MVNELVSLVCVGICVASVAGIISMIVINVRMEVADKITNLASILCVISIFIFLVCCIGGGR